MEETIGYEALFSPEEWDAIKLGDWSVFPDADWDGDEGPSSSTCHLVKVSYFADNDEPYRIACDRCCEVGSATTLCETQAIARLHESFVAVLVDTWSVEQ